MPIYKVSYVVSGEPHPGSISNQSRRPKVKEQVRLGSDLFEITEVFDLVPPRGDFRYIHVTCKRITPLTEDSNPPEN